MELSLPGAKITWERKFQLPDFMYPLQNALVVDVVHWFSGWQHSTDAAVRLVSISSDFLYILKLSFAWEFCRFSLQKFTHHFFSERYKANLI